MPDSEPLKAVLNLVWRDERDGPDEAVVVLFGSGSSRVDPAIAERLGPRRELIVVSYGDDESHAALDRQMTTEPVWSSIAERRLRYWTLKTARGRREAALAYAEWIRSAPRVAEVVDAPPVE